MRQTVNGRLTQSKRLLATGSLLVVTLAWGSTFTVMKNAIARQPVLDFLFTRFAVATVAMFVIRPALLFHFGKSFSRAVLVKGSVLGIFLGFGYIAQTFGLERVAASSSGFITGLFVLFTPLLGALLFGEKLGPRAWLAVLLATGGLALLSLRGWSIGRGELLTLLCAILFAAHIVGLGRWSAGLDPYALTVVQLVTVSLLTGVTSLSGGFQPPPDLGVWGAVGLTAILATAVAFVIQTWAQSLIPPTRAAVIMTMEPAFAALFAVLIGKEILTFRTLAGGVLVMAAIYLMELSKPLAPLPHLEP